MTTSEFSDNFDILVNSYARFKDFDDKEILDSIEFNEYEKSVFLTKAQTKVIIDLYTGRTSIGESFESTEELRRYLSELISTNSYTSSEDIDKISVVPLSSDSKVYLLSKDIMFITYEAVTISDDNTCLNNKTIKVVPTTQDEFFRIQENPFKKASKRQALRLDLSDNYVEIVCPFTISKYTVRYIKKPSPIILEDLPNDLTIDGESTEMGCILNPSLHNTILNEAVILALQSKLRLTNSESNK